jgi:hypothetical protein
LSIYTSFTVAAKISCVQLITLLPKDLTECSFHVLVNVWTLVSGLFLFTFSKNTNSLLDTCVSFIISCFHLNICLDKICAHSQHCQ